MRDFRFENLPEGFYAPSVVRKLTAIHEQRGRLSLLIEKRPDALEPLREKARAQSADASSKIAGIFATQGRLGEIMTEKTSLANRTEQEIAGYRDVLALISESYPYIDLTPSSIQQLHALLYRYSDYPHAGQWRGKDAFIVERAPGMANAPMFATPSPADVPRAMTRLCAGFNRAIEADVHDPLVLIAKLMFDFVCIRPFEDGNGRMSRLIALLALERSGHAVGEYASIEGQIGKTQTAYCDALRKSSPGWAEEKNSYRPFVEYLLDVVLAAYREVEREANALMNGVEAVDARIEAFFAHKVGKAMKHDIVMECPDVALADIERALGDLEAKGRIEKVGSGRATGYLWKNRVM